jgi:predicted nuclease with TOPRIM domain
MFSIQKPNIFILLDLDPDLPWDQEKFEKRLKTKLQEWRVSTLSPTAKGRQAKINMGFIPEIKEIAGDEALRKSQAVEARQIHQKERTEKLRQLEEHLGLLQEKGYLLQAEYDDLAQRFRDIISDIELSKKVTVEIRTERRESG